MKSAVFAVSLLSALAVAIPLMEEKRYLVTEVIMKTATVTVTGSQQWGNWPRPTSSNTLSIIESSPTPVASSSVAKTPSIVPSSTSSAAQPSNTGGGSISAYADPILDQHNIHRRNHSAPDIEWDDNLANIAAQIAASCKYAHDTKAGGGGYGQNIGAGAPDDEINKMVTNQMYNDEMMLYPGYGNEPIMDNFERWGHFSQIVWKETTKLGCHTQYCPGGLEGVGSNVSPYFTVCNYQPVGNFGGQYAANVLAPRGDPMFVA